MRNKIPSINNYFFKIKIIVVVHYYYDKILQI